MDTSLQDFRAKCLEATIDLLWRQWCSLGVSGHAAPVNQSLLLDPEALLLATTTVGRSEPRLFDEMVDWLNSFGGLVSLQRLKNLQHSMQIGDQRVLSAISAWMVTQKKHPRWKALVSGKKHVGDPEALFVELLSDSNTVTRHLPSLRHKEVQFAKRRRGPLPRGFAPGSRPPSRSHARSPPLCGLAPPDA
jgi:hypothetical protein